MAKVGEFVAVDNEFLIKEISKFLGFSSEETNETSRKEYHDLIMKIYEKWIKDNVPPAIESHLRVLVEDSRYLDWVLYLTNKRYRDHYQHQFNVGALGWFLLQIHVSNDMTLEQKIADRYSWELKDVHTAWWISSLLHDHGYPISYLFSSIPAMRIIGREFEKLKTPLKSIEGSITQVYHYTLCCDFAELIYNKISDKEDFQEKINEGIGLLGFNEIESKVKKNVNDHGVLSATNLTLLLKDDLNEVLKEAAKAIALHNNTEIEVEFKKYPLAFLLILCDELQEWGRKMIISDSFVSELKQIALGPFLKKRNNKEFPELLKVKFEYEDAKVLKDTNWSYELFKKSKLENFKRLKFPEDINPQKLEFEVRIPSSI